SRGILLLCSVLCLLPICYLVLAVTLFKRIRVPAKLVFQAYDPAETVLPLELAKSLDDTGPELAGLAFRSLGHFEIEQYHRRYQAYLSVFTRDETNDRLWLINSFYRLPWPWRMLYQERLTFVTEFSDGQILETRNGKAFDPSPEPPDRRIVWLPRVR